MTPRLGYKPLGSAFPYIGSKYNLTLRGKIPPPKHSIIIEAFAGSAPYSRIYHRHTVILIDRNPKIIRAHKCLQTLDERVDDLPDTFTRVPKHLDLCARDLLGLWAGISTGPRDKMSPIALKHPKRLWNKEVKNRLAAEARAIKHWRILEGSAFSLFDVDLTATWLFDAPYQNKPGLYEYDEIDFDLYREFVHTRRGQVIVCENAGANWLDGFVPIAPGRTKTGQRSGTGVGETEVLWYKDGL